MTILPDRIKRLLVAATVSMTAAVILADRAIGEEKWHSVPQIANEVNRHLHDLYLFDDRYSDVQITTSSPDPRLRLAKCDTPLKVTTPQTRAGGRVTSQVACQSPTAQWSVYVISQVKLMAQIVVARVPLLRGQAITEYDVELASAEVTQLGRGFYAAVEDVLGMEPRRSLSPGDQLRAQWLVAPKAVKRGERVTIIARSATVAVEATGTALSDGRLGEQIRVRNERSDRVVKGTVSGDKLISISL